MATDLFFTSLEARPICGLSCLGSVFYRGNAVSGRRVLSEFPKLRFRVSKTRTRRRSVSCVLYRPTSSPIDSSSSSSSSSGPDFGLVSTTECSDGSIIFRFGDVREVASTGPELDKVASEDLSSPDAKVITAVEVVDKDEEAGAAAAAVNSVGAESLSNESTAEQEVLDEDIETAIVTSSNSNEVAAKSFSSEKLINQEVLDKDEEETNEVAANSFSNESRTEQEVLDEDTETVIVTSRNTNEVATKSLSSEESIKQEVVDKDNEETNEVAATSLSNESAAEQEVLDEDIEAAVVTSNNGNELAAMSLSSEEPIEQVVFDENEEETNEVAATSLSGEESVKQVVFDENEEETNEVAPTSFSSEESIKQVVLDEDEEETNEVAATSLSNESTAEQEVVGEDVGTTIVTSSNTNEVAAKSLSSENTVKEEILDEDIQITAVIDGNVNEVADKSLSSEDKRKVVEQLVFDKYQEKTIVTGGNNDKVASKILSEEDTTRVVAPEVSRKEQDEGKLAGSVNEITLESLSSEDTKGNTVEVLDKNQQEEDDSNHIQELEESEELHPIAENRIDLPEVGDNVGAADGLRGHSLEAERHEYSEPPETTVEDALVADLLDSSVCSEDNVQSPKSSSPLSVSELSDTEVSAVSSDPTKEEVSRTKVLEVDTTAINLEEVSQLETSDEGNSAVISEEVSQTKADPKSVEIEEENAQAKVLHLAAASVATEHDVDTSMEVSTTEDSEEPKMLPASTSVEDVPPVDEELRDSAVATTLELDATESPSALDDAVSSNQEAVEDSDRSNDMADVLVNSILESQLDKVESEREGILRTEYTLSLGAASLPHPSKALTGAEDAYFIYDKNWVGIADGAGQWSLEGLTAGSYSHSMMENCKAIVSTSESSSLTDPVDVLVRSAAKTDSLGISTVLILHFDGQVLNVANIGDSGFIIIRNGTILERSTRTVHALNFPVQIERGDDPSELAECYRIELDEDDVIVSATNGLFDNLYEQEIASIIRKSLQAGLNPQDIAEVLATRAQEAGQSTSDRTPFADSAHAAGYTGYTGGKLDDVTVVVSLVQKISISDSP